MSWEEVEARRGTSQAEKAARRKYLEDLKALAIECFARHEVAYHDIGTGARTAHIELARRYETSTKGVRRTGWDSAYRTEIVCLRGREVYVGGDIDAVTFAYCDSSFWLDKVRWIGRHEDMDYVLQKASVGTAGQEKVTKTTDEAVAIARLEDIVAEAHVTRIEDLEFVAECEKSLRNGDGVLEVERMLLEEGSVHVFEALEDGGLGRVIAPSVVYAWAALRRATELLA